jgi:hypothetical protein
MDSFVHPARGDVGYSNEVGSNWSKRTRVAERRGPSGAFAITEFGA